MNSWIVASQVEIEPISSFFDLILNPGSVIAMLDADYASINKTLTCKRLFWIKSEVNLMN